MISNDKKHVVTEGPLHKKLRTLKTRFTLLCVTDCLLAVVLIATVVITAPHLNSSKRKNNNTESVKEALEKVTAYQIDIPVAGSVNAISATMCEAVDTMHKVEIVNLLDFEKNSVYTDGYFKDLAYNFKDWCYDSQQLTIDFKHTYTVDEKTATIADISNVVNPQHKTGYMVVLKPTYSQGMYYDFNDGVNYYLTLVNNNYDKGTPWIHVTENSNTDLIKFCQESVLTSTSVFTVESILKAIAESGNYQTQDGVLANYFASCVGDLDDQLLTPAFSKLAESYLTRVDVQVCDDDVYCIVTYRYQNSSANVTEETFSYKFSKTRSVIGYEFPTSVVYNAIDDCTEALEIIREV